MNNNNTELSMYGIEMKTETIILIKVGQEYEAYSKSAIEEILKQDKMTKNMTHMWSTALKMIEDAS